MVAIDAERIDESGVRIQSAPTAPQVPRWLQGIATINRLRSVDTPESINPEAVSAALQQLCSHGKIAERVSAARVLPKISRQCDPEVIDFLLGDTISSASCGEFLFCGIYIMSGANFTECEAMTISGANRFWRGHII
jgi:hypothetical protein